VLVFGKPLSDVEFKDAKALQTNQICESDILDYKTDLVDDDQLIKQVTAFANTRGGLIVFGVEETGRGGFPKSIPGIDQGANKERMEQILLSNISPRLGVKIREIPHENGGKCILIVQIPDSYLRPHMNLRLRKFEKRYQFEAVEMDEREVSEAYRTRFATYETVEDYLNTVASRTDLHYKVRAQIVVIPTILDARLIDTSNKEGLAWLDYGKINPQPQLGAYSPYVPDSPVPSPRGVVCQRISRYLELHRNGCVEYGRELGSEFTQVQGKRDEWYFAHAEFCVKVLHTLQFASIVYSQYNYFGEVKVVVSIQPTNGLIIKHNLNLGLAETICQSSSILVDRSCPSTTLESDYSVLAASIMHEIFNHFGYWRCPLFDSKDNYLVDKLEIH
jgi:hypothetical protein